MKGEASRCGSKASGLRISGNGWDIGVVVVLRHDAKTGKDVITITRTGGSNGSGRQTTIAVIREGE
jgi:hypothetical protein